MNVLLVTEQVLDIKKNKVVSDFAISSTIRRFQTMGTLHIACCKFIGKTAQPLNVELDLFPSDVTFLDKETDLRHRYFDRKHNRSELNRLIADADFVIGYAPSTLADLALSIAKKQGKRFMIFLVGCVWDALSNHRSWKARLMAPARFLETRHTVRHADYVWYVTQHFLQHRYPTCGLAFGGTDTNIPPFTPDTLSRRLHKIEGNHDELRLLTVGHVDVGFKGQHFVVRALPAIISQGINAQYYIIGDGQGNWIKRIAQEKGVADRVHLLGRKSREEVIQFMDDCDIYIQPSLQEGLPRSVAEAMSRAMPCIVTNVGGMSEMIDTQFTVRARVHNDIAKAVAKLTVDEMKRQARRNFEKSKQYQPDYVDKQLLPFFEMIKSAQ